MGTTRADQGSPATEPATIVRPSGEATVTGGRPSIEELYRSEHARTVRLALLLTGDAAVADDLAQEAFARLLPRYDDALEPAGYLRRTIVNLCRDHGRRQTTVRRNPPPPPRAVDPPALPADLDVVWRAVQALPERRRVAVVLRYWLDLSTDDIATTLAVRPATVRSLLRRGLSSLEEVLHDDR